MKRLTLFFPNNLDTPRVEDRRVMSAVILIDYRSLLWCDAAKEYGSSETLYNR